MSYAEKVVRLCRTIPGSNIISIMKVGEIDGESGRLPHIYLACWTEFEKLLRIFQ